MRIFETVNSTDIRQPDVSLLFFLLAMKAVMEREPGSQLRPRGSLCPSRRSARVVRRSTTSQIGACVRAHSTPKCPKARGNRCLADTTLVCTYRYERIKVGRANPHARS
jgi:hypothetical protein